MQLVTFRLSPDEQLYFASILTMIKTSAASQIFTSQNTNTFLDRCSFSAWAKNWILWWLTISKFLCAIAFSISCEKQPKKIGNKHTHTRDGGKGVGGCDLSPAFAFFWAHPTPTERKISSFWEHIYICFKQNNITDVNNNSIKWMTSSRVIFHTVKDSFSVHTSRYIRRLYACCAAA